MTDQVAAVADGASRDEVVTPGSGWPLNILKRLRLRPRTTVAVITMVAGVVRLIGIGSRPLWMDEAYTLAVARGGLASIWNWGSPGDSGDPPLFFALVSAVTGSGHPSELRLRLLSAVAGTLLIPVVYMLGMALGGRAVGIRLALAAAIAPMLVWQSQDARMYSLLVLELSVALLGLVHLWKPRSNGRTVAVADDGRPIPRSHALLPWFAYTFGTGLALLTHHVAILFWVACNVVVFGRYVYDRSAFGLTMRKWIAVQFGCLAIWLLWIPGFVTQLRWFGEGGAVLFPKLTLKSIAVSLYGVLFPNTWLAADSRSWTDVVLAMALGLAAAPALLVGFRAALRSGYSLVRPLLAVAGVFWLAVIAASLVSPILVVRTMSWTVIALLATAAVGADSLRDPFRRRVVFGLFLIVLAVGTYRYHTAFENAAWDDVAAYVEATAGPDDTVLFFFGDTVLPFRYYMQERSDLDLVSLSKPDASEVEPSLLNGANVWLIYSHEDPVDPERLLPDKLLVYGKLTETRHFREIDVFRYVR